MKPLEFFKQLDTNQREMYLIKLVQFEKVVVDFCEVAHSNQANDRKGSRTICYQPQPKEEFVN